MRLLRGDSPYLRGTARLSAQALSAKLNIAGLSCFFKSMLLSSNTLVYFSLPEGYAADTYPRCRGTAVGEVEFDTPKDVPPFDLAPLGCAPKVLAPFRVIN